MWCHLASDEAKIDRAHNMVNQNVMITQGLAHPFQASRASLIASFMGPTWGPSGADRTQLGPMLAPWTLLSGMTNNSNLHNVGLFRLNNWMLSLKSFTSHNCSWMICIDPFRKGYLSTLSWWTNCWDSNRISDFTYEIVFIKTIYWIFDLLLLGVMAAFMKENIDLSWMGLKWRGVISYQYDSLHGIRIWTTDIGHQGPIFLTWTNSNPIVDK